MIELHLQGAARDACGVEVLELDAESVAEALRGVALQCPEFRPALESAVWRVVADGQALEPIELLVRSRRRRVVSIEPALIAASGKTAGKIIGGVFLAILSIALGPIGMGVDAALLSAGWAEFGALAGASLALGGVSSMLAPSPSADPVLQEDAANQRRYFAPPANLTAPGQPIPLVYGEALVGSVVVSAGQTIVTRWDMQPSGNNIVEDLAWLRVVDVIAAGEIEGLYYGNSSVYIDGERVEEIGGGRNINDIRWTERKGLATPPASTGPIRQIERSYQVGLQAHKGWTVPADKSNGSVERTITDANVSAIRAIITIPALFNGVAATQVDCGFEISANGGAWQPVKATFGYLTPDIYVYLNSIYGPPALPAAATKIECISAPGSLTDPGVTETDITLHWAPVADPTNVQTVTVKAPVAWRPKSDKWPVTHSLAGWYASAYIETPILPDDLYECWTDSPDFLSPPQIYGDEGYRVGRTALASVNQFLTSPYQLEAWIPNLAQYGPGPWVLRFYRTTADSTTSTLKNETHWTSYAEVIDADLDMPDLASVELEISSDETGGRIPRRTYLVRGRKVLIPDNYDPIARTYSGVWGGTFAASKVWTDNPAWCLYDLLTETLDGLGLQADKWSLYAAGKVCDETVLGSDGVTLEPRYTFNGSFTTLEDRLRVAQAIASTMHATLARNVGSVGVVQDAPGSVQRIYGPANVVEGRFSYSGIPLEARYAEGRVTWRDPADKYRSAVAVWRHEETVDRFGVDIVSDRLAPGCTVRGQAEREARWLLGNVSTETQIVKFRVSAADLALTLGDVISIRDPLRDAQVLSGRIAEVTGANPVTQFKLDRQIQFYGFNPPPGAQYALAVPDDHGTLQTAYQSFTADTLTDIFTPDPAYPIVARFNAGVPYVLTGLATGSDYPPAREWRVFSIARVDRSVLEVKAHAYDAAKYAAIDDPTTVPSFPEIYWDLVPPPTYDGSLITLLHYTKLDGTLAAAVQLDWTDQGSPAFVGRINTTPERVQYTTRDRMTFWDVQAGTYTVTLAACDAFLQNETAALSEPVSFA